MPKNQSTRLSLFDRGSGGSAEGDARPDRLRPVPAAGRSRAASGAATVSDVKRLLVASAVALALGLAVDACVGLAAGPPAGLAQSLTTNGRVIWNLDALLNDTFGNRVDCFDDQHFDIFSVPHGSYCPSPEARYQEWDFTFLNAFHSQFRLLRLPKEPDTGATNVPVRIGSRYVSCPGGEYHH